MKKAKKLISALLGLCLTVSAFSAMPVNAKIDPLQGDVDGNGKFSLVDVVAVNRWLHNSSDFHDWRYEAYQWKTADLNGDGIVNVIDLALMKRSLIETVKALNPVLSATNLSKSVNSETVEGKELDEDFILKQTEFYLNLMQKTAQDGANTLISPYSVVQALAMTANGAQNQTLEEMQNVIGGGMPMEELNKYLYTQRTSQPNEENCKLLTANSIWCRDKLPYSDAPFLVKESFLQKNKNFYNADIFTAPFDETTIDDINKWTNANTDKMIPKLINELNKSTVMCLINAVTFDAKWSDPYYDSYTRENWFTDANGTAQNADILYSEEHSYLSDEHSQGFMKYYEGGRYAFVGILPEEGMTTTEYLNTLTADSLHNMLVNRSSERVITQIPKFSYDYSIELPDTLKEMGMPSAFEMFGADFHGMADLPEDNNLYISNVIHKTFIELNETGTRAAAATIVVMDVAAEAYDPQQPKEVILNRPFVYYIVDTETNLPIFMGTVESLT
ncbi:MAG TPA: serine protease [Ruminococcus sp.]|nr:serine protease [Ruminococcus sp.]